MWVVRGAGVWLSGRGSRTRSQGTRRRRRSAQASCAPTHGRAARGSGAECGPCLLGDQVARALHSGDERARLVRLGLQRHHAHKVGRLREALRPACPQQRPLEGQLQHRATETDAQTCAWRVRLACRVACAPGARVRHRARLACACGALAWRARVARSR
eukprot:2820144-Prymnesium_polylepis.1